MRTARSSSRQLWGSISVHAGIPPGLAWRVPPCVGLDTPQARPLNFPWVWAWRLPNQTPKAPPRCGPEDLQGMLIYPPPQIGHLQGMLGYHLQGMLGYHLQGMLGYHSLPPPMDRMTDTCKNKKHNFRKICLLAVITNTSLQDYPIEK